MTDKRKVLTDEQVEEIKELLKKGLSQRKIAQKYKVSQSTVNKIKQEKTWKNIVVPTTESEQ